MLGKCVSLILVAVFFCTAGGASLVAQERPDAKPSQVEKIRRKVFGRGTGAKARVSVKLNDGTKLKGYVSESTAEDFTLMRTDAQKGTAVKINYGDVRELKAGGGGMSTTSKVLIGAGIGVGVTVGALALMFRNLSTGRL